MKTKERNKLPIKLLKAYQRLTEGKKKWCRYSPTCSNYAIGCYEKFNFFKASFLTLFRILRCNPLFRGGYDPVPLTKTEKLLKKANNGVNNSITNE